MAFTDQQLNQLSDVLDQSHVRSRTQAGRSLSYVEGWHAIAEANRIFGFDAWDRELVSIQLLGEPRLVEGKHRVGYRATVRITVRAGDGTTVVRDGAGFGSGIDRDVDQAHESALKEAETDAMKRALVTFGNPFGLALYDKEQRSVGQAQQPAPQRSTADAKKAREYMQIAATAIRAATDRSDLAAWWQAEKENRKRAGLTDAELADLRTICSDRAAEIGPAQEAA
ncbi:hypothetical protein GCM10008171_32680 [Methylopila jiangsuensis]|uniref:Rad52/22 family double-strand break repair protein n=1 Tax=Methylopila jiangsuensis TaxID=586230 RepID=A0A9W6JKX1_9HYPH|nr:RAD52 family DNA repair protein [Methylopila jiangsuensis]MDR6284597.1 DNA repair and recombination protein RAD52 [Methylopila jiangsuensis]GLK78014.1 hypothetical protein GCM10008171_32680 [Methylopila jiangsuensis]